MFIDNLTEWTVLDESDVLRAMETGQKNRSSGRTDMNEHSSRSHRCHTGAIAQCSLQRVAAQCPVGES